MSIDMYVGKSKSQASDVKSTVKSLSSGYDSLQKGIIQFVSESELQGQAYNSGKQFFVSVIEPLTESIKTLGELTEQACNDFVDKYQSEVDSQSLKESELEEDIRELEKQISQLEEMNASLSHKSLKNHSVLAGNKKMIGSLKNQKQELEEKLRKLRQFNSESPSLFKEVESFQKTVQQGINQAKTAWDPGKKVFNIPSGKQMGWAKVSQQKALEVRMDKINQKAKDGKTLNKNDLQIVMGYARNHPQENVPKNLKEYMIQNKDSITRDLGLDIASSGVEQVGFNMQKFAGVLNTYGGFKGPNGKNSFVQVTNKSGNQMIKHGRLVSNIGKAGGYTTMGVSFGLGMYDDLANNNKTIGEATVHNGLTTVVGVGASLATTAILSSNPIGWAILGGIAVGTGFAAVADLAYQNNWFSIKDGVDWTGHQIDKGIDKYIDFKTKQIAIEAKGALYIKNKLQDSSQEVAKTVKNSTDYISNKAKKVEKNVGEAANNVKKVVNPMKWSW
ncbi:transposase [Staphylococcus epidermidis]|uniref:T7SS effector LXG polymorphic toxin n=1 Tax=Staphylococcus epidermidis TaxID=1282 RepID=UPI001244C278|nr:T7SS effector LXG polymorphic toxin [Staphylococcus epidermidis]KAA9384759.1 transposase [Staphylococcus epidermidis]MBM6202131.1 transposase [Staphylococcus epidermidis]MBM6209384.1 transposase [Staphylococcus epidermidis]MBM6211605.1 transposase [Staphylococcus epidermidis]MBM6218546.1 transposase [Staphylococcus epidermidis]